MPQWVLEAADPRRRFVLVPEDDDDATDWARIVGLYDIRGARRSVAP
ncbi:MAG: hypothetical protein M3495_17500 [Pseudomonadota bacterium]|nr:hypothetical protein [Gammaproteobacteria bacterium]MDQ3583286.1 hypothetical protein [Pseudomonadota bacterium]